MIWLIVSFIWLVCTGVNLWVIFNKDFDTRVSLLTVIAITLAAPVITLVIFTFWLDSVTLKEGW